MQPGFLFRVISYGMIVFISASCNDNREIPFPGAESNFTHPVSKKFSFAEPETINWKFVNPDSIAALPVNRFDYQKIPAKPFDIGGAYPLLKPMTAKKLDFNNLKDTVFDLKALPTRAIKYRTVLLGEPKIVKAGMPGLKPGASRGILSLGLDMGIAPNSRAYLQDSDGLMWICSDKGLYRYDGQTVTFYGLEQGLTDADLYSIAEDNNHQIWLGGQKSIQVLDRAAGLISQVVDSFSYADFVGIMKARDGVLWMSSQNRGVVIIDPAKQTISRFDAGMGLNSNFSVCSMQDSSGLIWITAGRGVCIVDLKKGTSRRLGDADELGKQLVWGVAQDNRQRIWIARDSGVSVIDASRKVITHLGREQGLGSFRVSVVTQDSDGLMWLGTFDGKLFAFDEKNNQLEKFEVTDVAFSVIYNIFHSKDGQLWIGSVNGGGYLFNHANGRPGNFTKADGLGDNRIWDLLEDSGGKIWIGTYNGIDVFDPVLKTIRHLSKDVGLNADRNTTLYEVQPGEIWATGSGPAISIININEGTIKKLSAAEGLFKDNYSSIVKDREGSIWIGTDLGNIIVVDLPRKLIKSFKLNQGGVTSEVLSLIQDKKGQIWAGTLGGGAFVIDPVKNTVKRLSVAEGLLHDQVTTFTEDNKGNIWIGTEGGINIANLQNHTFTNITMKEGLASRGCYTIDQVDSNVYVGTSNGLTVFPELTPAKPGWFVKSIGKGQGMAFVDFAQNSSLVTRNGQYMAGVDNQILAVLNKFKIQGAGSRAYVTGINLFDKAQRFPNRSFFDRSMEKVDTLWRAENGSYYVDKRVAADSAYPVNSNITWDSTSGAYNIPVNMGLPYNQNYLSFNFNGMYLSNPDKTRYRYILQGIDKNWSPVSVNTTSENYRDLPAGKYIFKVSTAGMDGVWSEPSEFKFSIVPPVWKTWWAYTLYLLLAGLIVWSMAKYRLRSLERQNKHLEAKVNQRTEALNKSLNELKATQSQLIQSEKMASLGELTAGIAHEIQNPLNFVNNFSEINTELIAELQEEMVRGNISEAKDIAHHISDNEHKINHHGKRAEAIVRSMLQHSRSGSVQKEPTDVNSLADEYFRLSFHGLRAKDKSFNAVMHTDFEQGLGMLNIRGQDIGRVLLNLVNNAFYAVSDKAKTKKAAGEKFEPLVSVTTKSVGAVSEKGQVLITVRDNGNGIPARVRDKIFQPFFTTKPTGEGTGLGLSLAYDIIKSHGGVLSVDTKEGEYTEFQILLPRS